METYKLLASPLNKAVNFMEEHQFKYSLKEIKPPFKNEANLGNDDVRRVLKIEKENGYYLITWSFQYNS